MSKAILPQSGTSRRPVQRNTFYEAIKVLVEILQWASEGEPPSGKPRVLEDNLATAWTI